MSKKLVHIIFIIIVIVNIICVHADITSNEITPMCQETIERGLNFLAKQQDKEGFWRADVGYKLNTFYRVTQSNKPHVGITALACLAFLANGNLPNVGRYGKELDKGIEFILSALDENTGYISKYGTRMYSHAFATLCLAEVYGVKENVKPALEKAVNLIIECQNSLGGWRYEPIAIDADMSITVCQVQALRAARNVGISVPKKTIDRAIQYIKRSAAYNGGFYYQVMNHQRSRISFALTAAGITALHGTGVYNDTKIQKGLKYLLNPPPNDPHPQSDHYFFYYGHYYAIQAMFITGSSYWNDWYSKIRDKLIDVQNPDGSWKDNVGKNFATSMALIILQVPYRYLPILQR